MQDKMQEKIEITINWTFLENEPIRRTWYNQMLYMFTRPIARFVDKFNIEKLQKIYERRKIISAICKMDFINAVGELLFDEVLAATNGRLRVDESFCKKLCQDEATIIYYNKKNDGSLDELNRILY